MRTRGRTLLALALALSAAASRAQPEATTVALRYRSAESLITVLRPLVGPAMLSGAGMQLQVFAPPSELQRVMHLVRESDRPLRPLRVALSDAPEVERPEVPPAHGSVTLSTGRPLAADSYGNGQTLSTHGGARPEPIEVLEGEPLSISMPSSQSLWFGVKGKGAPAAGAAVAPAGAPDVGGVVHFDSVADFTARIWLAGEEVAITLEPRAAGTVDAGTGPDSRRSAVYGRLGQWIALADPGTSLPSPSAGASTSPGAGLWIRVETAGR
jgi:hypothetical protein